MLRITDCRIVTEDTLLKGFDIIIRDDRIESFIPAGQEDPSDGCSRFSARGGLLAPGFVDIHSDYIEHMAAPRPTALMDFNLSLRECEKELVTHGITTMFHSLSLFKTSEFAYKPIRQAENVQRLIDLIEATHVRHHLIRHRFHARLEIDNLEQAEHVKEYIRQHKVHLLSFMDHTPGQGQYRDLEVYRKTLRGYNKLDDQTLDGIIDYHLSKDRLSISQLREIAAIAGQAGIALASHDDDSADKLDLVASLGATISEFPISLAVARQAQTCGMLTTAGAPNVLLGGSHSGNLSAEEAILDGSIDILCSDYYPASLLHAVYCLHRKHRLDLAALFRLVTLNPARAVRHDHEIGSIRPGKKADLLLIDHIEDDFPVIAAVWVNGDLVMQTHYRM